MSRLTTQDYTRPAKELNVEESIDTDARQVDYKSSISDNEFINSLEFKAFLYKQKGKEIREMVDNVTPSNEE